MPSTIRVEMYVTFSDDQEILEEEYPMHEFTQDIERALKNHLTWVVDDVEIGDTEFTPV